MTRVFNRTLLFLLVVTTLVAISVQFSEDVAAGDANNDDGEISKKFMVASTLHKRHKRMKRASRKPGFFRTLFSVVFDQYNDTKYTINKISSLVNDNFLPENAPPVVSTTPSSIDPNVSTTKAPYKITRSEFNRIVQRNLRGLARLYNIELRDALKQSDKNWAEYKRNASIEVSKFL
ncbi:uncharacterized protein [Atheta coriaria]|uniref:uncharacterized protein n=1 Tax=Dalotia coriaria TaxID=877792 RepID=UPI0031F33790